jgi:hypothetical protein
MESALIFLKVSLLDGFQYRSKHHPWCTLGVIALKSALVTTSGAPWVRVD